MRARRTWRNTSQDAGRKEPRWNARHASALSPTTAARSCAQRRCGQRRRLRTRRVAGSLSKGKTRAHVVPPRCRTDEPQSTRAVVGFDPGVDRWDRNDGRDRPQLDLERPDLPAVAATVAAQRVLVARAVTETPHPHRPSACTCGVPGDPWDLHVNGDKVVVDVMTGAVVAVGADAPVACRPPIGASPWCRCCGVPRLRTKS